MSEVGEVEQTWRLQDSIPPPPLQYHGFTPNPTNNPNDILYYAVNSMNLTPEDSGISRITYDPVEAQESLARSFQPFSDQIYERESRPGKRSAGEDGSMHVDKRYHASMQPYESNEGYAMS